MTTQATLLQSLATEEQELEALLARIGDEQWATLRRPDGWSIGEIAGHIGDSCYGMALMAERAAPIEGAPTDSAGRLDINAINEQRRAKHATMSREKLLGRVRGGFAETRRAIEQTADADLSGPGPFGPNPTKGDWLRLIIDHTSAHRKEIEDVVGA